MALTAEQKAAVLKKRDSLIASGSSITDATRLAFDEVAGAGQFESRLATKAGIAGPLPAAQTAPSDLKELKKKTDTQNLQTSLVQAEQDWVRSRRSELKDIGYGDAEAASQAQKEFNEQFGQAPATGFGEYGERKEEYLLPIEKILPDVLGRKTFYPEDKTVQDIEASRFRIDALPFQTPGIPTGIGPDFNKIKETLKKDSGLSEEEAKRQTEALRQAYDKALKKEVELSQIGRDDLPDDIKRKDATITPEELAQKALEKAIAEIEGIQSVGFIQPEKARSEELRKIESSTLEKLGLALGKQETAGQGVPDYSDVQLAYLKSLSDQENEKLVADRLKAKEKAKAYSLPDGTIIPEEEYKARIQIPDDLEIKKAKEIEIEKTEQEIRKELADIPWYLDPAKKKRYLANPEKYVEEGILSDRTIYGGQRETVTGQLLRGALLLPNAVAGATSGLFEGFGEGGEAVAAEKRRRRPEAFKDNPILYNIAENRGFFGEGQETADILGLEGPLKYIYLGGTFAADILDPSLDVITAAGKGIKVTAQARAASKALGALTKNSSAYAAGLKAAANDILDNTFLSVVAKDPRKIEGTRGAPARFKVDDPRTLAISDLTASLEDSQKIADRLKADPNITAQAASAGLGDTGYAREFNKAAAASPGAKASDVAASIRSRESLIKTADEISKGLDEVLDVGSTRLIRSKELARQLGAMAATDPRIADAFRAVDASPVSGVQKITQYVRALDADQVARLRKGLIYDAASTQVYKATKEMSAFDNLVAVTKNTFVDKSILEKIMAKASASKIGQISKSLKDAKIVFKGGERGVSQAFQVTDAIRADIKEVTESLAEFRKLDGESLRRITRDLSNGYIFTSDLRRLVDANIDLIAEGVASSGSKVTRARDVARLPVSKQLDLLVPLESRAFTREVLKEWFNKLTSRFTKARSKLSIGQQQLLKEAFGRAGSLDIKLRTAVQDLLSKSVGEGSVRAAYGVPADKALTKSEALSYAVVGPVGTRKPDDIKDVLEFGLQNLFYNKSQKQDIFNLFNGVDIARDTSILTDNGKIYFDKLMDNAAKRISDNPESLFPELIKIQDQMREILKKARSDTQTAKDFFRVNPNEIVDIAAEGAERSLSKAARGIRKIPGMATYPVGTAKAIPQEVSVGLYYKAEADRIQKELISDLVNTEIGKGQVALTDTIKEDYFDFIRSVESRLGIKILDSYPTIISDRIDNILSNPAWKETPIDSKDIERMLFDDAALLQFEKEKIEKLKRLSDELNIINVTEANLRRTNQRVNPSLLADRARLTGEIDALKQTSLPAKSTNEYKRLRQAGSAGIPEKAEQIFRDPEAMSAISTVVERAEDIALGIIRQNDLTTITRLDDIEKSLKGIVSGTGPEDAQLKLLLGEDAAEQLKDSMTKGFDSLKEDLRNQLIRGYEGRGALQATKDIISNLFEKINDYRYTLLLNLRPRFHGANLITAADIYYSTTGKLPNYVDAVRGLALTQMSRTNPNKIILQEGSGKAGRLIPGRKGVSPKVYTAREVYDLLSAQGGRSVYSLTAPNLANKRALQLTDDDFRIFGDWWKSLGNLPTIEDMAFRYSVFADAIRAGRSEAEALELARKSMFDAADINALERPIQKLLMFYGFARNNFVNFAKNLASPEGQKRIMKFLRAERSANDLTTNEEDREFAPGYTQTKAIYAKLPVSGEKDIYLTTPAIATKEAVKLFGEILKGNYGEVLTGMVNPTYKEILGISGSFDRDPTKISPEHVAIASLLPGSTPEDIFSWIVGSEIVPRAAKPEDGAVNGYIYPLTTPNQIKRYKTFIDLLSYTGISAPVTDWSRTLFGEGTPVGGMPKVVLPFLGEVSTGKVPYALGGMTPSYGIPAWKQDYFNKLSKLKAIKESAAKIEKEVGKETSVESAELPQTPEAAALEATVTKGQAAKAEAKSGLARVKELRAQLEAAKPPNTKILEQYNYDTDRMYEEYIKPKQEELAKLLAELAPTKAPAAESRPARPERQPRQPREPRPPRPARNR